MANNEPPVGVKNWRSLPAWLAERTRQVLIPFMLGVSGFFAATGGRVLAPRNIAWITDLDAITYYLGWLFYRSSPWTFPLGMNPRYGDELSSSIMFVDNVPLLSLLFKALGPWLSCEARAATLAELPSDQLFDSVLYIDVLEHIADDAGEARLAAERLRPGGTLIVLAPAHQWLFSPFDQAIGHFRRYNKKSLAAAVPAQVELVELVYLDAVGLLASAGNRFISRNSSPTPAQIRLWDRVMVPLSRRIDPLLGRSIGKSVLGVWRKP